MLAKCYKTGGLLLALLMAMVCQAATPVMTITHWRLDNGAKIYLVKNPQIPIVDIRIVFNAGSAYDGKQWGIARLTARLLDEGTTTASADAIATQFAKLGAIYSAGVDLDHAAFSLRSLSQAAYLNPAVATLSDIMNHPRFPTKAFARAQKNSQQRLRLQQQSPAALANNAFYHALYGQHPYGHNPLGTTSSLAQLTPVKLHAFYDKYYVGQNAKLIIVGDISKAAATKLATSLVGQLPAGHKPGPIPRVIHAATASRKHIPFPSVQTHVLIGQVAIKAKDPRHFALLVGNYILGGNPLISRLFQVVRVQHALSYSVGSGFSPLTAAGPFRLSLQTKTKQTQQAIALSLKTLNQFLHDGPSAQELQHAKASLIGRFPLGLESNAAILTTVSSLVAKDLPLNYLDTYRQNIQAVTLAQIKHAFTDILKPQQFVTITVGK